MRESMLVSLETDELWTLRLQSYPLAAQLEIGYYQTQGALDVHLLGQYVHVKSCSAYLG